MHSAPIRTDCEAADAHLAAHFPPARYKATSSYGQLSEPREISATCYEIANDVLLSDVDSFVEFLDTYQRDKVSSEHATRRPGRIEAADNATVLHAAIVAATRKDGEGCLEAMRLLVSRYVAANGERIHQIASEFA